MILQCSGAQIHHQDQKAGCGWNESEIKANIKEKQCIPKRLSFWLASSPVEIKSELQPGASTGSNTLESARQRSVQL